MVSIGRREFTDKTFRQTVTESIKQHSRENTGSIEDISSLVSSFYYLETDITSPGGYKKIKTYLDKLDKVYETKGNLVYYLAVSPEHFETIVENIMVNKMTSQDEGYKRVVIEKPFGRDLATAKTLNNALQKGFQEEQIYRIDHYLGKEMLQNIMAIRFANTFFEPLWNNKYIDHVQITSSETLGVGNRGGYYESSGAIRDMMQNHMLQLLMLTAMEAPVSLDTDSIRDEKVKVLKAMSLPDNKGTSIVRGQYDEGMLNKTMVPAYRGEPSVGPDSNTETFISTKLFIDNFRWSGVPFYLRTGKRLAEQGTQIVIQFLELPSILYYKQYSGLDPNRLIIEIQPREGVKIKFNAKKPGSKDTIVPVEMDFCQNCDLGSVSPEAYERLILDVMAGDSTLFTRWDEVEYAWRFIDKITGGWKDETIDFPNYASGTWGPIESDELINKDGRKWINF